tara:strand:- start:2446 stop:2922 length:477 start_codon:yes stop_codon:yes gene_type:complete
MANEIQSKFGTPTALDFSTDLDGLLDQKAVKCADITAAGNVAPQVRIFGTITTSASADANSLVEFYFARGDGTIQAGGDTTAGAQLWNGTGTGDKNTVQFVHALVVQDGGTSTGPFSFSFLVDDPGPDWHLIVANETSDALHTSGNSVRYRYITPEVQ